jgi:excisionase family DNA binding protein
VSITTQPLAYSDADVASLLHVSKRTVYRLRKSGALPAVHIGRAVRTTADVLAQFLERARLNGERRGERSGAVEGKLNESERAGSQQSEEAVRSGKFES